MVTYDKSVLSTLVEANSTTMLCRLLVIIRLFHISHLHPKTPQVAKFVVVLLHEAQRGRDGWRSRINNFKHRGNAEIMVKFSINDMLVD